LKEARRSFDLPDDIINAKVNSYAQKQYQRQSFTDMMKLLSTDVRFILNRAHLGEYVYAQRYRGYSGEYVFDLEKNCSEFLDTTLLVLLHTSSFDFIKDDGLSFDFSKKDEEQMDFVRAFEKSSIKHKLMLDVHDGSGNFVPTDKLLGVVTQAYHELPSMQHQIMHTSWHREDDGSVNCHNFLQPDSSKIVN